MSRQGDAGDPEKAGSPDAAGTAPMWSAGRGRRGRRRRQDESVMVPEAEFRSYYGRPILKAPTWTHDIAIYLFTGGLAAGSSMLAAGADVTGAPALRRAGRLTSLGALLASSYFLIEDLGRKERFYNMLRVAKPTSPMSVGTWILVAYGSFSGAAAVAEAAPLLPERGGLGLVRKVLPAAGSAAGFGAAAVAPALATYTAVLFADTAVPSWHEVYRELPFVFSGSALASGAGMGLLFAPPAQAGAARRAAVLGAAVELAGTHLVEHSHGLLSEPYREGEPGKQLRAARALTVAGLVGAVLGRRSRVISALAGSCLLTGSLATRFGVFYAGVASTKDPKYVVVPQRERLEQGRPARSDR